MQLLCLELKGITFSGTGPDLFEYVLEFKGGGVLYELKQASISTNCLHNDIIAAFSSALKIFGVKRRYRSRISFNELHFLLILYRYVSTITKGLLLYLANFIRFLNIG